jgi:hypothetical protein
VSAGDLVVGGMPVAEQLEAFAFAEEGEKAAEDPPG